MIHTLEDFINIIIYVSSQLMGRWFPPVGNKNYSHCNLEQEYSSQVILEYNLNLSLEEFFYKGFDIYKVSKKELYLLVEKTISYLEEKFDFDSNWYNLYKTKFHSIEKLVSVMYEHLKCIFDNKAYCIPYSSSFYPYQLKTIVDPPVCLNMIGNLDIFSSRDSFCISIIGARKALKESLLESFFLSSILSRTGIIIVSGGAYGCDIYAHLGAYYSYKKGVSSYSNTIVVLAGGLGKMYPPNNIDIFNNIYRSGGVLVSEKLWNYQARKWDFPVRNRIISGLSNSVVLIQAGEKSGASLTCQLALNQGRDLFVLLKEGSYFLGNTRYFEEGALGFFSAKDFINNKFYRYCAE